MQRVVTWAVGITVLLAIAGLLAACGQEAPPGAGSATTLSDAETVWCRHNAAVVGQVGRQLALGLPKGAVLTIGSQKTATDGLLALGVDPEDVWKMVELDSVSLASVATAWMNSYPADYLRACRAAFGSR
jgi:ABC-type Fe3+-hydroxamate transport system substrate-binding protein